MRHRARSTAVHMVKHGRASMIFDEHGRAFAEHGRASHSLTEVWPFLFILAVHILSMAVLLLQ